MHFSFAGAMISNYKQKFKDQYGRETTLSNEDVFVCIESVGVASTGEEQDQWTLEEMLDMEQNND